MTKKRILMSVLILLGILIAGAGINYAHLYFPSVSSEDKVEYPVFTEEDLASVKIDRVEKIPLGNIKSISKKYHLYENIFNSDKPVLIYGYEKKYRKPPISEAFHKELMKELSKGDYSRYNIVGLTDINKFGEAIFQEQDDDDSCFAQKQYKNPEYKPISDLIQVCYPNSCIVDPQENIYFVVPKAVNLIARVLELYK